MMDFVGSPSYSWRSTPSTREHGMMDFVGSPSYSWRSTPSTREHGMMDFVGSPSYSYAGGRHDTGEHGMMDFVGSPSYSYAGGRHDTGEHTTTREHVMTLEYGIPDNVEIFHGSDYPDGDIDMDPDGWDSVEYQVRVRARDGSHRVLDKTRHINRAADMARDWKGAGVPVYIWNTNGHTEDLDAIN